MKAEDSDFDSENLGLYTENLDLDAEISAAALAPEKTLILADHLKIIFFCFLSYKNVVVQLLQRPLIKWVLPMNPRV